MLSHYGDANGHTCSISLETPPQLANIYKQTDTASIWDLTHNNRIHLIHVLPKKNTHTKTMYLTYINMANFFHLFARCDDPRRHGIAPASSACAETVFAHVGLKRTSCWINRKNRWTTCLCLNISGKKGTLNCRIVPSGTLIFHNKT